MRLRRAALAGLTMVIFAAPVAGCCCIEDRPIPWPSGSPDGVVSPEAPAPSPDTNGPPSVEPDPGDESSVPPEPGTGQDGGPIFQGDDQDDSGGGGGLPEGWPDH